MTDEQWEKIAPLVEAETRTKLAYEACAIVPVCQPTAKVRIERALALRKAEIEWAEARTKLQRTIKEIAGVEVFI